MISIRIPCYNQPHYLNHCLASIKAQTYNNYKIVLIDDCSTVSYSNIINKYTELNIHYIRNKINKGAIANMIYALKIDDNCELRMVFHEDDIMQPNFLEIAINSFISDKIGLVGSFISFFDLHKNFTTSNITVKKKIKLKSKSQLARLFLSGAPLGFGTIIYRKNIAKIACFNLEHFDVMGDRPMLIELLSYTNGIIIPYPLVAAYSHWDKDVRWKTLKHKHVFNLYKNYQKIITPKKDTKLDKIRLTHGLISGFKLIGNPNFILKIWYISNAYFHRIVSLKYAILYNNCIRSLVEKIKI